jgi:hypothetical protein
LEFTLLRRTEVTTSQSTDDAASREKNHRRRFPCWPICRNWHHIVVPPSIPFVLLWKGWTTPEQNNCNY